MANSDAMNNDLSGIAVLSHDPLATYTIGGGRKASRTKRTK